MKEGEALRLFIENQPKSKISIARDLNISKQTLFQYFKSKELTKEIKDRFEGYFGKKIFGKVSMTTDQLIDSNESYLNVPGENMGYNDKSIYNLTESNRMLAEITQRMGNVILDKVALLDHIKLSLDKIPDTLSLLTETSLQNQETMTAKILVEFEKLKDRISSAEVSVSKKISQNQKR